MSSAPPRQRLLPLFVVAMTMMVAGLWVAFADTEESVVEAATVPKPFIPELAEPPVASADVAPQRLAYGAVDKRYRLDLRQRRTSGDSTSRTQMAVDVREEGAGDAALTWERSFRNATVQTWGSGGPIGPEVSREVARLIDTARQQISLDVTGELMSSTLLSNEAAQLRQLLVMIQDAISFLQPRLPRESVRVGERWSWEVLAAAPEDGPLNGLVGNTSVFAHVVGRDANGHIVMALALDGAMRVDTGEDEAEASGALAVDGEGDGWVVWDQAEGRVVESRIEYRQISRLAQSEIETISSLTLTANE